MISNHESEHSVTLRGEKNAWMSKRRARCYHLAPRARVGMAHTYLALTERSVGVWRLEF
jgi:hypothetical protein